MTTTASIADDWQDVSDDTFSVVSLPTSDEGSDDTAIHPDPEILPDRVDDGHRSIVSLPIRSKKPVPIDEDQFEEQDQVEHFGKDSKDVVDSDSSSHLLREMLDTDMDPTFLHKVTTSLIKLLGEIHGVLTYRSDNQPLPGTEQVQKECESLQKYLKSLVPIVEGYSKHSNPQKASGTIPLDPGLYEWMIGLRVELLGLQALILQQMNKMMPYIEHMQPPPPSKDMDQYHASLVDFSGQIESFLPIAQADYDEFYTANLPIASYDDQPPAASCSSEKTRRIPEMPPSNGLFHLRRELYALKDQVALCVEELEAYDGHNLSREDSMSRNELHTSYQSVKSSMETILSNHASDWLNYSMAGGINYPEFCRINPDTVRSLNVQLKELTDSLFLERRRVSASRYMNDPDSILDDEILAFKPIEVLGLWATHEVMTGLFRIKRDGQRLNEQHP